MKKDTIDVQQYIRRNNIEIVGIPSTVSDKDLEKRVVEIEACHCLKDCRNNKENCTIVRFVNRNVCDQLHQNKKKLKKSLLRII